MFFFFFNSLLQCPNFPRINRYMQPGKELHIDVFLMYSATSCSFICGLCVWGQPLSSSLSSRIKFLSFEKKKKKTRCMQSI